jgi:hypothetical protein
MKCWEPSTISTPLLNTDNNISLVRNTSLLVHVISGHGSVATPIQSHRGRASTLTIIYCNIRQKVIYTWALYSYKRMKLCPCMCKMTTVCRHCLLASNLLYILPYSTTVKRTSENQTKTCLEWQVHAVTIRRNIEPEPRSTSEYKAHSICDCESAMWDFQRSVIIFCRLQNLHFALMYQQITKLTTATF